MTIGKRIRDRRKELGLTQEELAKRLGNSSRASVCTVENDREDLTTTRILKFASALDVSPAYLMGWEDIPRHKAADQVVNMPNGELLNIEMDNSLHPTRSEIISDALTLYQRYQNASPEVRSAIELLLKAQSQES